jgi:hypothetical protein
MATAKAARPASAGTMPDAEEAVRLSGREADERGEGEEFMFAV